MTSEEPPPPVRRLPLRTYDGYHLAFALGMGLFIAGVVVGFRHTLVEHSRLPGIRLSAFDQADRQMAAGESDRALQQYRMAARISPWDRDAALRLARALAVAGSPEPEAEAEAWQAVIAIEARNVEAHLKLGQSLARAGRPREAAERFVEARALAPERLDVALGLGDALLEQGQPGAAVQAYRRALPQHAASAELHNALGIAWVREGKFDNAIAEFFMASTLSSDSGIMENLSRARADGARAVDPS